MDLAVKLIEHLLSTTHSIDRVDSIVQQLKITRDRLLQLLKEERCADLFQLLSPSTNRPHGTEKLALTLDLFCCTHYANTCKNPACPFLHLCPYNVRPMHTKCTNKTCPLDHDVLKSTHNRRIIDARRLDFIPAIFLHEITRASADPSRSFWVCPEYGKKTGCPKKNTCDKLHYCYYALTDSCTKPHCSHVINDACLAYFRQKELNEQDHDDILSAFGKVLRQRKPDYIHSSNGTPHPSSASASPKISHSADHQRKPSASQPHRNSPSAKRAASKPAASTIYDDTLTSKADLPSPSPDHDQDILLSDIADDHEHRLAERFLSEELRCPIRLLTSKQITSPAKAKQGSEAAAAKTLHYYYPIEHPADIFRLLHWQNESGPSQKPLIAYASVRDAHEVAKQNFENNQYALLRIDLFHAGPIDGELLPNNRLQLKNPSTMRFDRLWIYVYNFQ